MCIRNAVRTDVKKLPVWAYYYKVLTRGNCTEFEYFVYHKGMNLIPECEQWNLGYRGSSRIRGGGHFFVKKQSAIQARTSGHYVVKFKILRRDISHVGTTEGHPTVLARRAEMIGRVKI